MDWFDWFKMKQCFDLRSHVIGQSWVQVSRKQKINIFRITIFLSNYLKLYFFVFYLETVNLNSILCTNTFLYKDLTNFNPVISLQLYNLAEIFILNDGSIAGELLFEYFENFFGIEFFGESLDGC